MQNITKCGLGLRREHLSDIIKSGFKPDFWEVTPENWFFIPHAHRANFEQIAHDNLLVAHSVTLSIGSDIKPSKKYLKNLKAFLDRYDIKFYSDHISFSTLNAHHTHELLPLPLTHEMLNLLCERVEYVQNELKREIILENATYYYTLECEMSETEFTNLLMNKSGAKLLLDVNNVYVNSVNHKFDPYKFIDELDLSRLGYIHVAGHMDDRDYKMLVDTHGGDVCDEVWQLLAYTLKKQKAPCMIERDNEIPPLAELITEYEKMREIWKSA
ncbi:DUF692 domain-containing protein [Campylobacter sp. RM16187]|uniref:DUF692 domain-containing protein n=1 Tax=Campylobacter sp. RM16187 TaxID=1660063 RepID=UPI0021B5C0A4|nr:DUF692 domain-containing protein [Campylobacter sp. RM16187]QKG28408.1 putative DUF692 domain protein [Campylobacter sp. RM16187]